MDNATYANPTGISGWLALWWTRKVTMHITKNERFFIDSKVSSGLFGTYFLVTWVYGDPELQRIILIWESLRRIGMNRRESWICIGDFNYISHQMEKIGGRRKEQKKIDGFNELLSDLQIEDIRFKSQQFTWSSIKCGADQVMERLDKPRK